jgi:hypothetical protein
MVYLWRSEQPVAVRVDALKDLLDPLFESGSGIVAERGGGVAVGRQGVDL